MCNVQFRFRYCLFLYFLRVSLIKLDPFNLYSVFVCIYMYCVTRNLPLLRYVSSMEWLLFLYLQDRYIGKSTLRRTVGTTLENCVPGARQVEFSQTLKFNSPPALWSLTQLWLWLMLCALFLFTGLSLLAWALSTFHVTQIPEELNRPGTKQAPKCRPFALLPTQCNSPEQLNDLGYERWFQFLRTSGLWKRSHQLSLAPWELVQESQFRVCSPLHPHPFHRSRLLRRVLQ
jgi:hypothetical protein